MHLFSRGSSGVFEKAIWFGNPIGLQKGSWLLAAGSKSSETSMPEIEGLKWERVKGQQRLITLYQTILAKGVGFCEGSFDAGSWDYHGSGLGSTTSWEYQLTLLSAASTLSRLFHH